MAGAPVSLVESVRTARRVLRAWLLVALAAVLVSFALDLGPAANPFLQAPAASALRAATASNPEATFTINALVPLPGSVLKQLDSSFSNESGLLRISEVA